MYFHVYLIYRFTRTFTDHSSVITRCWGFELQNGKSSLKSPQTLATQGFAPASFLSTHSKKHRKLRLSVLFCCQNTETVILPAFDRRRRCCSLLRYFLRWKVFDELLHGGCRVGLLLHSKADWVVIGLLQERISILYGMHCKIRHGRMLTPRPLSTIAVMAKSSQAVKWMSDCT